MVIEKWLVGQIAVQDVTRVLGISTCNTYRLKAKYRKEVHKLTFTKKACYPV